MTHTDDELGGEAFRPSAAFCRALDNEQEYDSIDDIAMAGDLGEALPGLASTTEVRTSLLSCISNWLHLLCCSMAQRAQPLMPVCPLFYMAPQLGTHRVLVVHGLHCARGSSLSLYSCTHS